MDSSIDKLNNPHLQGSFPQTRLSAMCGTNSLFRERYRIIRTLGRGGFGVTFLAEDASLPFDPLCVIKQLCPKVSNSIVLQRASQRFEREAKTLSQLGSHAQVPQLLDYFQDNGEFYLVQEYIRGRTLAREIKQYGTIDETGVKRFLREILPVLEYIHHNKVIHRDIKPPNIIRCIDDGRLVLIDFGAVKEYFLREESNTQRGATTHFVGTLGFSPPEQLALRPTYASDIFALGVTCLYLMTGKPPIELEYDVITGEVKWQDYVNVSDHFSKVLDKMLRISPRERYQSAGEILRIMELEPYLDNLSTCLTTQPPLTEEELPSGYVSPIVRTAIAIRRWRKRLKLKEQEKRRQEVEQEAGLVTNRFIS